VVRFLDSQAGNTVDKLAEAKYFLDRMNEYQSDGTVFRYNVSAFVSASQSITWVMQTEFTHVAGFKQWYEDRKHEMQADKAMKDLAERRRVTTHIQPIPFDRVTRLDVSMSPVGSTQPSKAEFKWYFSDLPYPHEDIFTMCKKHVEKLEHLVQECESQFAK
jgi:hypothetical protein